MSPLIDAPQQANQARLDPVKRLPPNNKSACRNTFNTSTFGDVEHF
jgi:hypothetical protein